MKRYYYHGTTETRYNAISRVGRMKAPVFVFDDAMMATHFAERTAEEETDTPILLRLDLKGFRIHKDFSAPFIREAHTVRQDVPIDRIEEI